MQKNLIGFPGTTQVKVMRRRLLQHDLDMYAAVTGARPNVPLPSEPVEQTAIVRTSAPARSWSPMVLCAHLGQMCQQRIGVYVRRPDMADWVRRLSGQALERLHEAQSRLASAANTRRNPQIKHDDSQSIN